MDDEEGRVRVTQCHVTQILMSGNNDQLSMQQDINYVYTTRHSTGHGLVFTWQMQQLRRIWKLEANHGKIRQSTARRLEDNRNDCRWYENVLSSNHRYMTQKCNFPQMS